MGARGLGSRRLPLLSDVDAFEASLIHPPSLPTVCIYKVQVYRHARALLGASLQSGSMRSQRKGAEETMVRRPEEHSGGWHRSPRAAPACPPDFPRFCSPPLARTRPKTTSVLSLGSHSTLGIGRGSNSNHAKDLEPQPEIGVHVGVARDARPSTTASASPGMPMPHSWSVRTLVQKSITTLTTPGQRRGPNSR